MVDNWDIHVYIYTSIYTSNISFPKIEPIIISLSNALGRLTHNQKKKKAHYNCSVPMYNVYIMCIYFNIAVVVTQKRKLGKRDKA